MRNYQRLLSLILCMCLLFSCVLSSCGKKEEKIPTPDDSDPNDTPIDDNPIDENEDKDKDSDPTNEDDTQIIPLTLKNKMVVNPMTTRTYYPNHTTMLTRLTQFKEVLKSGSLTETNAIKGELLSVLRLAEKLNVYYDYYNHTYYTDEKNNYGAFSSDNPIGGGAGFKPITTKFDLPVTNDDQLHDSIDVVRSGEIIRVGGESVIDLSDYLLGGETNNFNKTKVEYQWTIKNNVTWIGDRGKEGLGGAILKITSYSDCTIVLEKNAKLSGLVIQGPDSLGNIRNADKNFSIGIVVKGSGVVIENCEISGFYNTAIYVENADDVTIRNCYFHDISGANTGYAVYAKNSQVTMHGNLFSNVTTAVGAEGSKATIHFHDNMDAGNVTGPYVYIKGSFEKDSQYAAWKKGIASISMTNNTLLSRADLLQLEGVPTGTITVTHNLFGYPECAYNDTILSVEGVSADIYDSRVIMQNNVFDVKKPWIISKSSKAAATPEQKRLGAYSVLVSDALTPFEIETVNPPEVKYTTHPLLPALGYSYYTETNDNGYIILNLMVDMVDTLTAKNFLENTSKAIAEIGAYANYIEYADKDLICIESGGKKYGAFSNGDIIGGGYNYSKIFTTGDYIVTNLQELVAALTKAKKGQVVFIPGDTYIDISDAEKWTHETLEVKAGVTLASDRGFVRKDGTISVGAVIKNTVLSANPAIRIMGDGARITGLVLQGPDPARHLAHWDRCHASTGLGLGKDYFYQLRVTTGIACAYNNVEFDNCEISGFTSSGINLNNSSKAPTGITVHHNYIHHNTIKALGYGVVFGHAYATISYNMFNYNRHSIAASGWKDSGYVANYNIEMGESIGHYFDMHGGSDRKDGTTIAGEYVYMHNNSFLGSWQPYVLRGIPTDYQL